LRNDLGVLFIVDLANGRLEAIPLKLEFAHTRSPTVKTPPGSGVGSATPARRSGRP
jgi:hypothetical protein